MRYQPGCSIAISSNTEQVAENDNKRKPGLARIIHKPVSFPPGSRLGLIFGDDG